MFAPNSLAVVKVRERDGLDVFVILVADLQNADRTGHSWTCSREMIAEELTRELKEDVEHRNALDLDDGSRFEFSEDGEAFDVARLEGSRFTDSKIAALVRFERAGRRINVRGEDVDVDFTAVLTLDPAGQCRFVVGEALYVEWEIRRMALELLFFGEPEAPE